ncbi:MAG: phospholipid carrier-dependent glycosyltransferase, partial [Proteobacteria bacterium]|nr:phospholipid carrier-dependent glycosyltransferase [Pseudomonadota bacterium]
MAGSALLAGAIVRFYMTYVVFRPSEHIFSDMQGYVTLAQRLLNPNHILNSFDLIQPMGTSLLLAGSFRLTGSLHAADALWLFMSLAAPVFWFIAARKMAGPTIAVATAIWASFDFSVLSFGSLFMSETPFTFFIAAGTACLGMAMTRPGRLSQPWSFAAGILWGISLLFRPHGICMLFMTVTITATGIWNRRREKNAVKGQAETAVAQTLLPFLFVAAIFAGYFSFKTGRPMLTSLGAGCQMVMGRLPDAAEARFEEPGTGIFHFYGSPVAHQRNPRGKFRFDFSV